MICPEKSTGAPELLRLSQGYYLQDKWQATKRLSLQFGMRYEFVAPPHWANDHVSGFNLRCGCFLVSQPVPPLYPAANVRTTYFDPNYHGFQPRVGIAYTLTPRTVLRSAFGIFMDQNLQKGAVQAIRGLWPWGASINQSGYNSGTPNLFFNNMPLGSSFYGPSAPIVSGFGWDNIQPLAYSLEWNFGIQRAITPNMTAEVDYVGSGSRHQEIYAYANTPLPSKMGPGPIAPRTPFYAQYPSLGQVSYNMNQGNANYDGVQAKLVRRFSAGLTFLASYTWSHCLDLQGGPWGATTVETIYDIRREHGSCDYDFPQLFTSSAVYMLPWGKGRRFGGNWSRFLNTVAGGWQMSGIVTAQSGFPFTVTVTGDPANVGAGGQRAQIVGNPLPAGFKQTVQQYYNKSAYATPAPYTFGNLGRNTLRSPDTRDFDFTLMKDFHLFESTYLEFRSDFFNLFNNVNLGAPNSTANSPLFMQITGAGSARDIQFALKLVW